MTKSETKVDRRTFLAGSAALIGAAAVPTAVSYARILGANDRLSLAHIGPGSRGRELAWIVAQHKTTHNVEITAGYSWAIARAITRAFAAGRQPIGPTGPEESDQTMGSTRARV